MGCGRAVERRGRTWDGRIRAQDLSLVPPQVPVKVDGTDLNVVERQAITRVLRDVNGNKTRAARELGISSTQCMSASGSTDSRAPGREDRCRRRRGTLGLYPDRGE
jgi:transcriptional regulator with GAF, ATPase, and Fis domain